MKPFCAPYRIDCIWTIPVNRAAAWTWVQKDLKNTFIYNNVQFNLKCWSKNNTHIVNFTNKCNKCMPFVVSRVYSIYSITRHIDPDLHCHILCLCGSLLSPGQRLVVVHLVAHRLLPIDGFGLQRERREKRRKWRKMVLDNSLNKNTLFHLLEKHEL